MGQVAGRQVALVVEPDHERRQLAEWLLEESDYRVIECRSREAALDLLQSRGLEITLCFVSLAQSERVDSFIRSVTREYPWIRVVLTGPGYVRAVTSNVTMIKQPWSPLDLIVQAEWTKELRDQSRRASH